MERWWRCVWYFKINQIFPFLVIKPPFLCFFSLLTQGHRLNLFGTLHRSLHLSNSARCCFHSDATIDTCHPSHTRSKLDHNYHLCSDHFSLPPIPHRPKKTFSYCAISSVGGTRSPPQKLVLRFFLFSPKKKRIVDNFTPSHTFTYSAPNVIC